jgi:WhiB family transcriptional regulator, redox-sensing transcriptional regulator
MDEEAPVSNPEWQLRAACRSTTLEIFYSTEHEDIRQAIAMCRRCPVRRSCLEAAVDRAEWFGVWGATTERERRRMIRDRQEREDAA